MQYYAILIAIGSRGREPVQLMEIGAPSPQKRKLEDHDEGIVLSGGHSEKPRIIDAYRNGQLGEYIDVKVVSCDSEVFFAHRAVLSAGSDYFQIAFQQREGMWSEFDEHKLGDIGSLALKACLDWIYTGACASTDDREFREVAAAAHFLEIHPLLDAVQRKMDKLVGPTTAWHTLQLANRLGFEKIASKAAKFACNAFLLISAGKDWTSKTSSAEVEEVLSDGQQLQHYLNNSRNDWAQRLNAMLKRLKLDGVPAKGLETCFRKVFSSESGEAPVLVRFLEAAVCSQDEFPALVTVASEAIRERLDAATALFTMWYHWLRAQTQ